MVQPQAILCQDSTLMTLLEGPFLFTPGGNEERLRAKVTRKVVEDIEADGERVQNSNLYLV